MALFTDGPPSTIEDLAARDSQLLGMASTEGIDVSAKLAVAHEAVGIELQELLEGSGFRSGLGSVVVTAPLRLWHTFRALEEVYGDAYYNQLNDRYARKRDQFRDSARWALERLRQGGIGATRDPAPRASTPQLRSSYGALDDGTYYVTATWVNGSGCEGAPAIPAVIAASGGGFAATMADAPAVVIGWNVYVGIGPEVMTRQNDAVLEGGTTWTQSQALRSGVLPAIGQEPDFFWPIPRVIERG